MRSGKMTREVPDMLDNFPRGTICIEDIEIGMSRHLMKQVTDRDIELFAEVSTDRNPVHLDDDYAQDTIFEGRIAHGPGADQGNEGPQLRNDRDQSVLSKPGKRFPNRGSAYAEQLGQPILGELATRFEIRDDDGFAKDGVGALGCRSRLS